MPVAIDITARSYAGESDLPHLVELINLSERNDKTGHGTSVEELRYELNDPWIDSASNLQIWEDRAGAPIGFVKLYAFEPDTEIQARLFFYAHPAARNEELGTQMIAWAEQRTAALGQAHGLLARVRCAPHDFDNWRRGLLEQRGYEIERYALEMRRDFATPLPDVPLPAGFTLQTATLDDAERWTEMFNQSFIDHWNHRPWKSERFVHWFEDPDNDPALCLIAVAPDGTFAGFCWCAIFAADNARSGRKDGSIDLLGTRRGYRKRGLGRALLIEGMRRLHARGMDAVKLDVDAESPTGATRLYESVGFCTSATWIRYTKIV